MLPHLFFSNWISKSRIAKPCLYLQIILYGNRKLRVMLGWCYTMWLIWVVLTEIIWTAEPTISYLEFCRRIAISFSKGSGPHVFSCCLHSLREEPMAHFSFVGRRVMLLCFTKASLVVFLRLTWELSWTSGILCGGIPSIATFSGISGFVIFLKQHLNVQAVLSCTVPHIPHVAFSHLVMKDKGPIADPFHSGAV